MRFCPRGRRSALGQAFSPPRAPLRVASPEPIHHVAVCVSSRTALVPHGGGRVPARTGRVIRASPATFLRSVPKRSGARPSRSAAGRLVGVTYATPRRQNGRQMSIAPRPLAGCCTRPAQPTITFTGSSTVPTRPERPGTPTGSSTCLNCLACSASVPSGASLSTCWSCSTSSTRPTSLPNPGSSSTQNASPVTSALLTERSPWPHAGAAYGSGRRRLGAGEPGSLVGGTQQKSVMSSIQGAYAVTCQQLPYFSAAVSFRSAWSAGR